MPMVLSLCFFSLSRSASFFSFMWFRKEMLYCRSWIINNLRLVHYKIWIDASFPFCYLFPPFFLIRVWVCHFVGPNKCVFHFLYSQRCFAKLTSSLFVASWTGVIKYHGPQPSMRPKQVPWINHFLCSFCPMLLMSSNKLTFMC